MITLLDDAKHELDEFFKTTAKRPIRVYLVPGGCSGPFPSLALDDPVEDDEVEEVAGMTFCMAKSLKAMIGGVTIGLGPMGFQCTPEIPLPMGGGCSTCGGSCPSCH